MPIRSYLIFPHAGTGETLCRRLNRISGCEAVSAENEEILILVTDTAARADEESLQDRLREVEEIRTIILVFGELEGEATVRSAIGAGTGHSSSRASLP